MLTMKKSDINPMPEYFDRYINLLADIELSQAFENSIEQLEALDKDFLKRLDGNVYAAEKWTVKGIFQHLIDFERILSYRALLFARKEGSTPQGIDENLLAVNMSADRRSVDELIEELKIVRLGTKTLFESFDDKDLLNVGVSWKYEISVLAMGFNIIGHQIHHFNVIENKYFPLIQNN
ncbi:MAG: DinB family protein [Pyrinomonadaceae bacterium]